MWVAKIKLDGSNSLLGSRAKKYQVKIIGYPLCQYIENDEVYVYYAGEIFGEEKNIDKFVADLKKNKEVVNYEGYGNFHILITKRELSFKRFSNPKFVHVKPVFIDADGFNVFEIASFDRNCLIDFVNSIENEYLAELIYIKEMPIKHLSIISPYPSLSEKQRNIFELAVKEGYYDLPRKIDIQQLAKRKGISFSTFRSHLRKAEKKLLTFVFNYL